MLDEEKYDGIAEELPQNFPNHDEGGEAVATIVKEDDHQEDIKRLRSKYLLLTEEDEYTDEELLGILQLYEETMSTLEHGNIVTGTILMVNESNVIVDIGFKSEGAIPIYEFGENPNISVGDEVEVFLDEVEDQDGQIVLSKKKADFMKVWDELKDIYDRGELTEGKLLRRIKGGIIVDLFGVEAFLPGSQIDVRQVKNFDQFIGENFALKIIKLNKSRRNIVVSRRVVLEEERELKRRKLLDELEIGQVREGTVKNITDFGVFIDLGGVDGLLHITDMSWGRVSHPSELVAISDVIKVKVLNYEEERQRISLGLKQLQPYPWEHIEEKYPEGSIVKGKVVSTTDYGAFVELEEGVEGLVHISEMSWTQHVRHPSKIVQIGDVIQAMVLKVDKENEKISLGIKQIEPDPWETLEQRYPVGTRVVGRLRNLTNFGAFVEIEEGIDGLVHISDMSWTKRIHHPSEMLKKNQKVDVVILKVDKDNRRISLGLKQLEQDPWGDFSKNFAVGTNTEGKIVRLLDRGVIVNLERDVEGFVPVSQLAQPDLKRPAEGFEVGEILPLIVVEFDRTQRKIVLSAREYFRTREKMELHLYREKHKPKQVTVGDVVETQNLAPQDSSKETAEEITDKLLETPADVLEETIEQVPEASGEEIEISLEGEAEATLDEQPEDVKPEALESTEELAAEASSVSEEETEASQSEQSEDVQSQIHESKEKIETETSSVFDEEAEVSQDEEPEDVQQEALESPDDVDSEASSVTEEVDSEKEEDKVESVEKPPEE